MALSILSNLAANTAHRTLTQSDAMATRSLAKLSAGKRVIGAKDDAASMAIGARLNAEVQALKTATTNASQANSMLQIADGALATTDSILVRMKSLAVQASSENLSGTERGFIYEEFKSLRSEMDRIAADTEFNGIKLLRGEEQKEKTIGAAGNLLTPANGFKNIDLSGANANNSLLGNAERIRLTVTAGTAPTATTTGGTTTPGTAAKVKLELLDKDGNAVLDKDGKAISQELEVPGAGAALTKDEELNFDKLGIKLTLDGTGTTKFDPTTARAGTAAANDATITTGELNGQYAATTNLQYKIGTGANSAEDDLRFTLQSADTKTLNDELSKIENFSKASDAVNAITYVTNAINKLQSARASIGVGQNRLEFATQNLRSAQENNEASRSTLIDLDVAKEMTQFTSKQVLVQSGVAMLSQANQMPQNLLRLLQ